MDGNGVEMYRCLGCKKVYKNWGSVMNHQKETGHSFTCDSTDFACLNKLGVVKEKQ